MKSLVVEDDRTCQRLLLRLLERFGSCDVAENGRRAMEAIREAREQGDPYELICLDIMMPELDGPGTLELLRKEEKAAGIGELDGVKVIMTTAVTDKQSVLGAFRQGCEAYITKPVDSSKLKETIVNLGLWSDTKDQ